MINRETISVFDIFKIGVGPSSSHTLGPWRAALRFLKDAGSEKIAQVQSVTVKLYGSLAKTGIGHGTDIAILLGLSGEDPVTFDTTALQEKIQSIRNAKVIVLAGEHSIPFIEKENLLFLKTESLPFHPNGMSIEAKLNSGEVISETYFSIGGGFIVTEHENPNAKRVAPKYDISDADALLQNCMRAGLSISELGRKNETSWRNDEETINGLMKIWDVMQHCMYKGCYTPGILPGGLQVARRAAKMNKQLLRGIKVNDIEEWKAAIRSGDSSFMTVSNWVSCFALAVNEENASFGRVVTAPTNGAAGVVPAVLMYNHLFRNSNPDEIIRFLITAAQIGILFKQGSTISAAMGGCQAEIGVSSAMAAGALTECMGGTPSQVMQAAEIAMEHHLGLTCDPIGGLVQIPCIERNTMGAIKAITAAQLAMQGDADQMKVSLDAVIKTMWDTAKDMSSKYKETADGGLAIHVPLNIPEC